jgi:hypothetical protein
MLSLARNGGMQNRPRVVSLAWSWASGSSNMQVDRLNEELQRAWRKLEQQPGGLHCIDMLVQLRQHIDFGIWLWGHAYGRGAGAPYGSSPECGICA